MAQEMVCVGCRLPNGFVFNYPSKDIEQQKTGKKIPLKGANRSSLFEGVPMDKRILNDIHYGITYVPKATWEAILEIYADFAPIKSGVIFEAKNEKYLKEKAYDKIANKEKTGFEALAQGSHEVKTADNKDI
jgi:hypothetical protein